LYFISSDVELAVEARWATPAFPMKEEGVKAAAEPTRREAMVSFMLENVFVM
jgi:hypothetical protein